MFQPNLFFTKDLDSNYLRKIESIFTILPTVDKQYSTGRPPHSQSAMLNALIFKNLRGIPNLTELAREIRLYPALAQACGFKSFPSKERFSSFLKDTPNQFFQYIRENLIKELLRLKVISGKYISIDSCPVISPVKQNNLKTTVHNRFDKTFLPKGDPESGLGVYVTFAKEKKIQYFWGYKNHILNDAVSELPIAEITKQANTQDSKLFIPLFQSLKEQSPINIKAVIADSAFDSYNIIEFIAKELKAKPIIARNPRGERNPEFRLSPKNIPICIAGFEMYNWGKYLYKKRNCVRQKFVCPIKASKKFAEKAGFCPWNHPNFFNNRFGCIVNLRIDADTSIRNSIDYNSKSFKKLYALRTSSERIFSRFLTFCMQHPSIKGFNATSNVCTIAHITLLALALSASKTGDKDKIRFIKRLIPHF